VNDRSWEVAVVGAGVIGMATVKALKASDCQVSCFERGEVGAGQSGGATRVFRHTHDAEALVSFAVSARNAWREWEDELGRRLIGDEGLLRFGSDLNLAADRLASAGVPVEFLDQAGQDRAFRGLRAPADRALFEPTAGAIRARRTIEFLQDAVDSALVRAQVLAIEEAPGDGYRLLVGDGFWSCERLVLCAGTDTARLAAMLGIEIPITTRWHARPSFAVREDRSESRFACLQDFSGHHGESVYGSPVGRTGLYALGLGGPTSDTPYDVMPETAPSGLATAALVERVVQYVGVALKALRPEPVAVRICPTTKLVAGKDAFTVSCERGITTIAGNNLFKFAPLLGQLLAESVVSGSVAGPLRDVGPTVGVTAP
jgi:sarcosine oxidase